MPITAEQYDRAIRRIETLEAVANSIMSSISKLATLDQLRQLMLLRQAEINDIQTDIEELRATGTGTGGVSGPIQNWFGGWV